MHLLGISELDLFAMIRVAQFRSILGVFFHGNPGWRISVGSKTEVLIVNC
jgi:hypothetical protein